MDHRARRFLIPFLLLAACASALRAETDPGVLERTRSAGAILSVGNGLCIAGFWGFLPGIHDAGILTMMTARRTLAREYRAKFKEDPPSFGQSGESAYLAGWLMKGGAIGGLFVGAAIDKPVLGLVVLPILWLGGTMKHYEAQRLMYDDGYNRKRLILDEAEARDGAREAEVRLALPLAF